MKTVLLFLCIVAINTISGQNVNTTFVPTSTRSARPPTTQAPELSLDGNCGKTVSVKSNPTTYYAYNMSAYLDVCRVQFQRADQGKIQLIARLENSTGYCQAYVRNSSHRFSFMKVVFTPRTHARSTFTSDASGKLSVSVRGKECAVGNLSISVREACPANASFPCDNDKCLPQSFVCDGLDNCGDNSDETDCPPPCPEFTCTNGRCVPWSYHCDGDNDCHDNSDEANCPTNCPEFTCSNGNCVPQTYVCDTVDNCLDNSDEANCPITCPEFTCTNGRCVPQSYVCDNMDDCHDNSDEANCPITCPEFTCTNGRCVPQSYVCDNMDDCHDNSDEANCPTTCPEFTCTNGHCVSWSDFCDDYDDCGDYSDESGCTTFYWSGGAYAGISIGAFSFFSIIAGLFFYRRRRMTVAGPRILIPASQTMVVQSRW